MKRFVEHPKVDETDVRDVLYGNAAALFGVDLAAFAPVVERIGFGLDDVPDVPVSDGQVSSIFDVVSTVVDNR